MSVTTVSQALNGGRPVSPEARESVLDAVIELGYRPNSLARGLRTKRSLMLAAVIEDLTNPYYAELAHGLQEVASAKGYSVVACSANATAGGASSLIGDLLARQVDGLVLASFKAPPRELALAAARGVPLVAVGRKASGAFDQVRADEFAAARDMTTMLVRSGYSEVAHVAGRAGEGPSADRAAGYRAAVREAGMKAVVLETDYSIEGGAEAFRRMHAAGLPRAVFCSNDLIAIGFIMAAQSCGVDVPGTVAVAGVDDIPAARIVHPALTTVVNPADKFGRRAGELLLDRLAGATTAPIDDVLRLSLVRRDSA